MGPEDDNLTLAVLGAAGRTGERVVAQALERGYAVRGLARRVDRLGEPADRLTMIEGDARDPDALDRTLAGADAVISVLAPSNNQPEYAVAQATRLLISRMAEHGIDRLLVTAGAGVRHPQDRPGLVDRFIRGLLLLMARAVYTDMKEAVDVVRSSGLAWTVVRVPRLLDGPATGELRVGYLGEGVGVSLSRGDLASFLVEIVDPPKYLGEMPVVSS
ncbi:MAG: NAD(P)H-binding protein [Anaerolineales bacterium]